MAQTYENRKTLLRCNLYQLRGESNDVRFIESGKRLIRNNFTSREKKTKITNRKGALARVSVCEIVYFF